MPNFLILGTAKAGTTALYYYLAQHPQIFMSPLKEPGFFAFEGERPKFQGPKDRVGINRKVVVHLEEYRKLFAGVLDEKAVGEASPWYLYSVRAHERIRHHTPNARLIAVLRNPIDRAYSHFMHLVRDGREPLDDFAQAVQSEEARIAANWAYHWHYVRAGFYYEQIKRYADTFDRCQIKVYLYDDLDANPMNVLADIFSFLEVDEAFVPDVSVRYNVSGIPQNGFLRWYFTAPSSVKAVFKSLTPTPLWRAAVRHKNKRLVKPQLPLELRDQLKAVYQEDILRLQDLMEKDLSAWLN
ncbi:MAG: sulfotransferase [Thermosphaera sp.]